MKRTTSSGKALRLALVGAGAMGTRWAKAMHAYAGNNFMAIADIREDRARDEAARYGAANYQSVERMLADPASKPDACVVAVPNDQSAPVATALLAAGCHVLLEKPGGRRPEELASIAALAKKKRRTLMMGYNYRYFSAPLKAKEIVDAGTIGDIMWIRARHGFGGRKGYDRTWRHDKRRSGGGHLLDQGVHLIDLARLFFGDIAEVRGFAADAFWGSGVEDNSFVLLKNKKGRIASIHISLTQWDPIFSFEIYGDKGYVKIEGLGRKYGGSERVIMGLRTPDFGIGEERVISCDPEADRALVRELQEFASAIAAGRAPKPDGADGIAVFRVVEELYRQNHL